MPRRRRPSDPWLGEGGLTDRPPSRGGSSYGPPGEVLMKASSTLPFSPGLAGLFRGYSRRIRPHPAASRTTPETPAASRQETLPFFTPAASRQGTNPHLSLLVEVVSRTRRSLRLLAVDAPPDGRHGFLCSDIQAHAYMPFPVALCVQQGSIPAALRYVFTFCVHVLGGPPPAPPVAVCIKTNNS